MNIFSDLKNLIIGILGVILAILGAGAIGKRRGRGEAQEEAAKEAERVQLERDLAGSKAIADAADERREVEQKIQKDGADAARQNMRDRWTRK